MSNKKYWYQKKGVTYVLEEDLVGWYLIIYKNKTSSSEDYLFDTLDEALFEAEDRFDIPKNSWIAIE
ncbi:MAG: hypothetical protein Tsb0015_17280 [Simkaniaceae bacterium]